MKIAKVLLVILVLGAVIIVLPGCNSGQATDTAKSQVASVTRGNLTVEISAAGNLALAHTQDMAVDLFYPTGTKGTIGEVLVEVGDSVEKGQVLVTVDKSEWNTQLAVLEAAVTSKERALVQARINLETAKQTLKNAHDTISSRKIAVLNAEISLQQAESTLSAGILAVDYQTTLAELRKARAWYDYVFTTYSAIAPNADDYTLALERAQERLDSAQIEYDNTLAGYNTADLAQKKNQVEAADLTLSIAQGDLVDAQDDIVLKELSLTLSEGNLQDAEKALEDAKNDLTAARGKSPEIVAPFDGFITQVNVEGGDEVLNGTIAVQVADPDKFEADILVSEMDIPDVAIGSKAIVTVDALPTAFLSATVTRIAPTATISAGVVNYSVRVEVDSQSANSFGNFFGASENGTLKIPDFSSGNFTPPGDFKMPEGSDFPAFSGNFSMGQIPSMTASDVQLKEGFTVTVSITIADRTNVLLVPNGAVIAEGLKSYVQVVNASGELEKREVTTGVSNWQYTEIIEGLQESEQVSVTLNLSSSLANARGGMFFMGGR